MKNILILIGSPRRKGNTVDMAGMLLAELEGKGFQSEMLFLGEQNIGPCIDCRACKKGDLICTVKDGMQTIYPKLDEADLVIFGNPIYWSGPSAQTKLLVDRLRPYYGNKKLSGKKAALLLPAGFGSSDCDLTIEMFRRITEALGIAFLGAATAKAFDIGDASNDPQVAEAVRILASKID